MPRIFCFDRVRSFDHEKSRSTGTLKIKPRGKTRLLSRLHSYLVWYFGVQGPRGYYTYICVYFTRRIAVKIV